MSKTIKGDFLAKLTGQREYEAFLQANNIQCLKDAANHKIHEFAVLEDGMAYTAGPARMRAFVQTRLGWEILDTPDAVLKPVAFVGVPSPSYPNKKFTSNIDFVPWDEFFTEVKEWYPKPLTSLPVELPLWNNMPRDVARAVVRILEVVAAMSGIDFGGREKYQSSEVHPKFTLKTDENSAIAVVHVISRFFGDDNSLARLAKAHDPNSKSVQPDAELSTSAFATLQQLNAYFENSEVAIGVISDYDHFWFVRKVQVEDEGADEGKDEEGDEHVILQVSEALHCQSNAPTVLRAFGYLVSLAIREFQTTSRNPPDPTAAFVAEEKHLGTDSTQTPSSQPNPQKKRKRGGPPTAMSRLGFGRCGRVLLSPSPAGPVAVKFARKRSSLVEELQHEAHIYQQLAHLQGSVLPKLYHAGPVYNGNYYGLCLQPVGINVSDALELGVDHEFLKKASLDALDKLHAEKFLHGDIRESNICYEPQTKRVRLIDLGFAAAFTDEQEAKEEREKMRSMF